MPIAINGNGTVTGISVGGLPDGIVDTDMLAANAVTTAKSTGERSLGYADQWRVTSSFDGEAHPITNWERVDTSSAGTYGTAMSVTSGIFTFPVTGYWLIRFDRLCSLYNAACKWSQSILYTTTDNFSNPNEIYSADHYPFFADEGLNHNYKYSGVQYLFDVQDTSTHKTKFVVNNDGDNANIRTYGDTACNYTYATFIRLGDT